MNNKVNRWGPGLTTYNITFEWISGACNKAVDCILHLVELPQDKPVSINVLSVTDTNGPASTPEVKIVHAYQHTLAPHSQMLYQMYQEQKMLHQNPSLQIGWKLYFRCRKLSLSAKEYQKIVKWESTATWNWSLCTCKRLTVQTHIRSWSEIPSSGHTYVLEVYCIGWGSWQTRSPGKYPCILSYKAPVLLEGYEQGHQKIHCKLHPLLQRKSQSPGLPTADDRDSRQIIQQHCHRSSHGMQNLKLWKQAHSYNNWSPNRLARSFPHTR